MTVYPYGPLQDSRDLAGEVVREITGKYLASTQDVLTRLSTHVVVWWDRLIFRRPPTGIIRMAAPVCSSLKPFYAIEDAAHQLASHYRFHIVVDAPDHEAIDGFRDCRFFKRSAADDSGRAG